MQGVVSWRDQPVPVLNLAERLGLPTGPATEVPRRLLIAHEAGHTPIAFLVHPAVRLLRLPQPHQPCEVEWPLNPALVRAQVALERETVIIPHLGAMLATTEGS